MEPANIKTRGYIYFLLYFIFTATLIMLIGYIALKVPFNENDKLKKEMVMYEKQKTFVNDFSGLTNNTSGMIMDSLKSDTTFLNLQITDSVKKLAGYIGRDSVMSKEIFVNVVSALINLQQSKQVLRNTDSLDEKIKDLKDDIDKKQAELNNMNEIASITASK